jgi:hypothetical protein
MLTMTPPSDLFTHRGNASALGPTSLVFDGYRGHARGLKRPEYNANHSPQQVPRSRMSGAIPPPRLYALMAWRGTTVHLPLVYVLRFA